MNQNLKDTITTYAAIVMGIATTIVGLPFAVSAAVPSVTFSLPPIVNVICGIFIALSIGITQVLTGKNPNGTTKSDAQISAQNSQSMK
jgi:hypothetical protein